MACGPVVHTRVDGTSTLLTVSAHRFTWRNPGSALTSRRISSFIRVAVTKAHSTRPARFDLMRGHSRWEVRNVVAAAPTATKA